MALAELLRAPSGRRTLLALNCSRFHNTPTVVGLLQESGKLLDSDSGEALSLAEVAVGISRLLGHKRILATSLAIYGNVLRATARFNSGRGVLLESLALQDDAHGRVQTLSFLASLEESVRDFGRADEALNKALSLASGSEQEAHLLVQLGILRGYQLRPQSACRILGRALALLGEGHSRRLALSATHALCWNLADAGRSEHARLIHDRSVDLRTSLPKLLEIKTNWLEGHIAAASSELRAAAFALEDVQDFYASSEMPYEAALVSLELMVVLARLNRATDVAALSEAVISIFEALGIEPEARAARLLRKSQGRPEMLRDCLLALQVWRPEDLSGCRAASSSS